MSRTATHTWTSAAAAPVCMEPAERIPTGTTLQLLLFNKPEAPVYHYIIYIVTTLFLPSSVLFV